MRNWNYLGHLSVRNRDCVKDDHCRLALKSIVQQGIAKRKAVSSKIETSPFQTKTRLILNREYSLSKQERTFFLLYGNHRKREPGEKKMTFQCSMDDLHITKTLMSSARENTRARDSENQRHNNHSARKRDCSLQKYQRMSLFYDSFITN